MLSISICGTTTLSVPNSILEPERLQALPRLPRDKDEPGFAEPWQAQAFALAVKLSEQGHFTWKEWATALANELNAASSRGEPDDGSHYYDHWLVALEHLVTVKGLVDSATGCTQGSLGGRLQEHSPRSASKAGDRLRWLMSRTINRTVHAAALSALVETTNSIPLR